MPDAVPYPTFQEPTQQNPLQTMQGLTSLYAAQQEVRAKDAIGQIFQQSVGPDGKPDYAKAMTMMAGNPAAAWKLPEIAGQIAQRDLTAAHTTQVELQNSAARAGFLGQKAYALATAKGKDVSGRDISSALTDGVAQGLFEPKDATMMLANISKGGLQGQALADYLKTFGLQQQQVAQQHQIALQAWEKAFAPVMRRNETTGQEEAIPAYQLFGTAPPGLPPSMGGGGGAPGGASSAPGGAPGAGSGGASQLPGQPQRQAVPMGPTATQAGALAETSGPYAKELLTEADGAGTQLMQIQQARALLKQFKSGPARVTFEQAANLASSFGFDNLAGRLSGGGPGALAAVQDFEKFTVGMAANMAQAAVGSRVTNFAEQTFLKANANKALLNDANERLFDFAEKMAKLRQNKYEAFRNYINVPGHNPTNFQLDWQKSMQRAKHFDALSEVQGSTGLRYPGEAPK